MTSDDGDERSPADDPVDDGTPPGDDPDDGATSTDPSDTGPPDDRAHDGDATDDGSEDPGETALDGGAADGDPDDGERDQRRDGRDGDSETPPPGEPDTDASDAAVSAEIEDLRAELHEFRDDVEDRTLHRESVEDDLRTYVRRRLRRGHARGWGPYVVLLYGTLMTLGAFYYMEAELVAVFAMIVIWLSTLGLYVLMILVGIGLEALSLPTRAIQRVRERRS